MNLGVGVEDLLTHLTINAFRRWHGGLEDLFDLLLSDKTLLQGEKNLINEVCLVVLGRDVQVSQNRSQLV